MQKRVMILLLVLSLIVPSVLAATTVTDSAVITSGEVIGALNWSNLQSYPTPCAAGTYLTAVNDTMTCTGAIAAYTNIVLSNSTLMNTTILQLVSNLSGGASAVSSYSNIALTNQSNVFTSNLTILYPSILTSLNGANISNFVFSTGGGLGPQLITVYSNNDFKINTTGFGKLDLTGLYGVHYGYKQNYAWVAENLNPVLACNSTNYGQIIFPQSLGVLSYCAGNGWRNITDSTNGGGGGISTYNNIALTNNTNTFSLPQRVVTTGSTIMDGGGYTLEVSNSNASAEATISLTGPSTPVAINLFATGAQNSLLYNAVGMPAKSAAIILDSPNAAILTNSYGENITFRIGDGAGGIATQDQLAIKRLQVEVQPNILLRMAPNTTSMPCNITNAGSIIFSGVKHMGCDGTNWNFLY